MKTLIKLFSILNKYHRNNSESEFKPIYDFAINLAISKADGTYKENEPEKSLEEDITKFLDNIIENKKVDPEQEEVLRKKWLVKYGLDMTNQFETDNLLKAYNSLELLSNFLYADYQIGLLEQGKSGKKEEIIIIYPDLEITSEDNKYIESVKQKPEERLENVQKSQIFYHTTPSLNWLGKLGNIDPIDKEHNNTQDIKDLQDSVKESYDKLFK